jgi:TATA-binding protein-associated factor Taf7
MSATFPTKEHNEPEDQEQQQEQKKEQKEEEEEEHEGHDEQPEEEEQDEQEEHDEQTEDEEQEEQEEENLHEAKMIEVEGMKKAITIVEMAVIITPPVQCWSPRRKVKKRAEMKVSAKKSMNSIQPMSNH